MSSATASESLLRGLEPRSLDHDGARIRYFTGGAGSPLVLVHGLAGAATNWSELVPCLLPRHRLVVPDLPGHGASARLPRLDDLDPLAGAVAAVADAEGAVPAVVIGHSLGAVVALRLALAHPDVVRALVLVAPAGIGSSSYRGTAALALAGALRPARAVARLAGGAFRFRTVRRLAFGYWGIAAADALTREGALGLIGRGGRGPAETGRALRGGDPRTQLDDLACPVLVVCGARDRIIPPDESFEYARRLHAPVRTIAAAGHLLIAERPAELAAVLAEWLDGVR